MKWLIIFTPNTKSLSRIVLGSTCLDAKTLTLLASYLSPIKGFAFLDNYLFRIQSQRPPDLECAGFTKERSGDLPKVRRWFAQFHSRSDG